MKNPAANHSALCTPHSALPRWQDFLPQARQIVQAHREMLPPGCELFASIANVTENNVMKLIFNATAWANYADNAASSPQTNIGMSLHTGDPGEAGDATTSETTYTSYTRINVARTTGGFTVTNNSVSPVAAITFPAGTGGTGTVTHAAAAKSNATPPTGAQDILFSGTVTPNIVTGNGVTPQLTTASAFTLD